MHYRADVVLGPEVVDLVLAVALEVVFHSGNDVALVDGHVLVPVRPALLVIEAQGVHELMHDCPGVDTAIVQADSLFPSSPSDHAPATPGFRDEDVALL